MTDELKQFLIDNKPLLVINDFDRLYRNCPYDLARLLSNFLFNEANINPLDYMSTTGITITKVLHNVDSEKEVVIPKNITLQSGQIYGLSAPSVVLQCKLVSNILTSGKIDTIRIADGATIIPPNFLLNVDFEKIYVPKSVTRIGDDAFNCWGSNKIITPYRDNPKERLIVPNDEVEWYKNHLKFTHAPKENKEEII